MPGGHAYIFAMQRSYLSQFNFYKEGLHLQALVTSKLHPWILPSRKL